jgi:ribosomal-protein-alanine N-acetyltransferase
VAPEHRLLRGVNSFSVRRFREADLPAIQEIDWQSFWPEDEYDDAFYQRFATDPTLATFVALCDSGEIAGYALLDLTTKPVRLRSLAVHPNHRNAGCGNALLRAALAGVDTDIDLLVEGENAVAIRLYQESGFAFADGTGELPTRKRMLRCGGASPVDS